MTKPQVAAAPESAYRSYMRNLTKRLAVSAVALAGICAAAAQETLPAGPGVQETVKLCSTCHGIDIFRDIRRSEAMWEVTINNMISAGMTISDDEFDTVLAYLDTYMGLAPPPTAPVSPQSAP